MSVTQPSQGPSFGRPGSVQLRFPLVGRSDELASLEALLEATPREVSVALLTGEGGSGKTRVAEELAARAARRGWTVAEGRAYPVERGVPFALFSDAFQPILGGMDAATLPVLSRGGEAELAYLFPALGVGRGSSALEGMG
ncbi:MAG TPA: ATP-binding protein, partial [Longimicrobiales bacterium]|nr:ATP-binding protein [Longimicrobiales bacterium]